MRLDFNGIMYHIKTNYTMSRRSTKRIMILIRLVLRGDLSFIRHSIYALRFDQVFLQKDLYGVCFYGCLLGIILRNYLIDNFSNSGLNDQINVKNRWCYS